MKSKNSLLVEIYNMKTSLFKTTDFAWSRSHDSLVPSTKRL